MCGNMVDIQSLTAEIRRGKKDDTRNVAQCPTWWPPSRIYVAPSLQRRKVWLTPTTGVPCSNAAYTRNPLKLPGVPQTITKWSQPLVGRSSPYCGDNVEEILLLNKFFSIVDTCLSCEDIERQSCAMVPGWRFLATFCVLYFSEPRAACFRPAF